MDWLLWLVPVVVIVAGGLTYRRMDRHAAKHPGSFAWWQRMRGRENGWWW